MLDAPAGEVWEAISDERLLSEWLAPEVELDPSPRRNDSLPHRGRRGRPGAIRLLEEGERIVFEWQREGAMPSQVDLRIEELDRGTRLTVVESGAGSVGGSAGVGLLEQALRVAAPGHG